MKPRIQAIDEKCPNCNMWYFTTKNRKYTKSSVILEKECLHCGHKAKRYLMRG